MWASGPRARYIHLICVRLWARKRDVVCHITDVVCPVGKIACQSLQSGIMFLWEYGEHVSKVPTSYVRRTYIDWYSVKISCGFWSSCGIYLWNITAVSNLIPCSFVDRCKHFGATCVPTLVYKIDRGFTFVRKFGSCVSNYTASYPRSQDSPAILFQDITVRFFLPWSFMVRWEFIRSSCYVRNCMLLKEVCTFDMIWYIFVNCNWVETRWQ